MNYPYYISPQQPIPQRLLNFSNCDTLFAWLSIVIGFLMARALPISNNTLGNVFCVCILFTFCGIYFKLFGMKIKKHTVIFGALAAIMSVGFLTGANKTLHRCLFIFIILLFFYWVSVSFNYGGESIIGEENIIYALKTMFYVPFASVRFIFPALVIRDRENVGGKVMRTAMKILLGLAIAIVPTLIIIALLSYDDRFMELIKKIFSFSLLDIVEFVFDFHIGFVAAIVIFGIMFGSKRRNILNDGKPREAGELSLQIVPKSVLCATVTPILAVYVIFFISQWKYYVSAFTGVLPEPLTYAEYARNGFFQLCLVCVINAIMLLVFNLLIKKNENKKNTVQSIYSCLISVFTLILVATALSKMILYINSYGLTRKRIYASWLIILLALMFIAVLLKQFVKKIPLLTVMMITFAVCFAAIALPDVDGMIASYNADAYISGRLEDFDVDSASRYGASAVPALAELKEELESREVLDLDEEILLGETKTALFNIKIKLEKQENGLFGFNIPTQRAKNILKDIDIPG